MVYLLSDVTSTIERVLDDVLVTRTVFLLLMALLGHVFNIETLVRIHRLGTIIEFASIIVT